MQYVLLYVTAIVEIFCCVQLFGIFFEIRPFMQKNRILIFLLMIACSLGIFGINCLNSLFLNLTACLSFAYLCCVLIYKIKVGQSIIYLMIFATINITVEFFVSIGLKGEYQWIEYHLNSDFTYVAIFSSPLPVVIQSILLYLPVMVISHVLKRAKAPISDFTFFMYLLIPLLNLVCITALPLMGVDFMATKFTNIAYSGYLFLTLFGNFLFLYTFQHHCEEVQKNNNLLKEKLTSEHEKDLLEVSAKALKDRLASVEDAMEQERILRHDRHHFENTIYSLLQNGDKSSIAKAKSLLEEKINSEPKRLRKWCDNDTVNATLESYISLAEENHIKVEVSLGVPKQLRVDSLELSIAIANLLENAVNACKKLPEDKRCMKIKSLYKKQLLIQIENSCADDILFDEDGYPFTREEGHGIGTKSVMAFATQTSTDVLYHYEAGIFTVSMII